MKKLLLRERIFFYFYYYRDNNDKRRKNRYNKDINLNDSLSIILLKNDYLRLLFISPDLLYIIDYWNILIVISNIFKIFIINYLIKINYCKFSTYYINLLII